LQAFDTAPRGVIIERRGLADLYDPRTARGSRGDLPEAGPPGLPFERAFYEVILEFDFIKNRLESGCDIVTVQKLMGHSDIETTQQYLNPDEALKRKAVNRLPLIR
jgi:hypothetical protein